MKRLLLLALIASAVSAQSISITKPTASEVVNGYRGYYFRVSLASAPSAVQVCYTIDGYRAYNPGIDAPTTVGCSLYPPFSWAFNSSWWGNGSAHSVIATAFDARGAAVATSSPVTFSVGNSQQGSWIPVLTSTPGTSWTSNWAGNVNVVVQLSGSGAGTDSYSCLAYVDGFLQPQGNGCTTGQISGAGYTLAIYASRYSNGPHNVCVIVNDTSTGGTPSEECHQVTFNNMAAASWVRLNNDKIYLSIGRTFTLTTQQVNADGSFTAVTPAYSSSNTAVATVNSSTGVITAVANGNAYINAMAPVSGFAGTDLTSAGGGSEIQSSSHPLNASNVGWGCNITAGTGFTPGLYAITGYNGVSVFITPNVGSAGLSGGTFACGPIRQAWVGVWPTNVTAYLGSDGQVHTSWDALSAFTVHSMFSDPAGQNLLTDPGVPAQLNASAINTVEPSIQQCSNSLCPINDTAPNSGTYSSWQSAWTTGIAAWRSTLQGYQNIHAYLIDTSFFNDAKPLYGISSGPASTLSPPAFQWSIQQWASLTNSSGQRIAIGMNALDEGNANGLGNWPLMGPIQYGSGSVQNWLKTITATGGGGSGETCTGDASGNANGFQLMFSNKFVIHGSTITNMNNAAGSVYTATGVGGATSFVFPCANVADGTYNATNDPGMILEPNAYEWVNSNNGYFTWQGFAQIKAQQLAASPTFPISLSVIGTSFCAAFQNWQGNGTQSQGSITQFGQYSDFYSPNGTVAYLIQRWAGANILTSGNLGYQLRANFGCYNPGLPIIAETAGTMNFTGQSNVPAPGTWTCSGNTLTSTQPHGLANIVPGITRLYMASATDSGTPADSCNGNFYVLAAPTANSLTVALAGEDFTGSGTGGSISWQDGSTATTLANISAAVNANRVSTCSGIASGTGGTGGGMLCGDVLNYSGAVDYTRSRKRGQTMTFSGISGTTTPNATCLQSAQCTWNFSSGGRTFVLLPENISYTSSTPPPNQVLWYREIPILNATGGTAVIIPDGGYVKGRNVSTAFGDANPAWVAGESVECIILGCAGERIYQVAKNVNGYSDQIGFTGSFAGSNIPVFATSGTGQAATQINKENSQAVPLWEAHNQVALVWNRLMGYEYQPKLNSPDYGSLIDCGARAGSKGDLLVCLNVSDGPQAETFTLTPYLQSGQNIIRYVVNDHSISGVTIITAGTSTDTITLQPLDGVFYVFPANFSNELTQPAIGARLADVTNATDVVIRWSYDPYYLDSTGNTNDCGTGTCTPAWDRNIGTLYYRLIYLGSSSQVLAKSDIQTL